MKAHAKPSFVLNEQPFDHELLRSSRFYRKSRELFLKSGGSFKAEVCSSYRTLKSPSLLDSTIIYNPIRAELDWAIQDRRQTRNSDYFNQLRLFTTNLFHEQSHRILFSFLRANGYRFDSRESTPDLYQRLFSFMNFCEALVVTMDYALGDQLGLRAAQRYYEYGVLYSPGSDIAKFKLNRRGYRNYLQMLRFAVFLRLQGIYKEDLALEISHAFQVPLKSKLLKQVAYRASLFDDQFVVKTNPFWQYENKLHVLKFFKSWNKEKKNKKKKIVAHLSEEQMYLITEKWLQLHGL